jgi:CheY-like chemotaxis protein
MEQKDNTLFKKVMIIDDSKADRYIVSFMLKKFKLTEQIIEFESAKSALEFLASNPDKADLPSLIFLDIRMPEMDGFGFLQEYDHLPAEIKSNCVILMLSTSLDSGDRKNAESNNYIRQFLNKPLDIPKIEWLKNEFREAS